MNREKMKKIQKQAGEAIRKYKFALLILLLGLIFLLWPQKKAASAESPAAEEIKGSCDISEEETRLTQLLSQIDGVGEIRVMLTVDCSEQNVYQSDQTTTSGQTGSTQENITVITAQNGTEKEPVLVKRIYPLYRGAVIVCQGADRAAVRLAVIQAVSGLTGLGSDKITVVKMKNQ